MSDYIKDEEVETIVRDLVVKYPELFDHIDPSRLLYAREISRSQKTKPGNCRSVRPPYNLLDPDILYIIVIYFRAGWDELSPAQRSALVMHQLLHISKDFDGATLQHDISDWAFLVDNLGSDYLGNGGIPDLRKREGSQVEDLSTVTEED